MELQNRWEIQWASLKLWAHRPYTLAMATAYFEHFVFSFFHTCCDLTQTTQLADDGGQRVVGYTFQLIANPIRYWSVAEMPWLNVPLD